MVGRFWVGGQATSRSGFGLSAARRRRALVVVVPLTSQIRNAKGEVFIGKPRWLSKPSAVNVQGFASIDRHALMRKLGRVTADQLSDVKDAIRELLNL